MDPKGSFASDDDDEMYARRPLRLLVSKNVHGLQERSLSIKNML
jgi:hypothetical protein